MNPEQLKDRVAEVRNLSQTTLEVWCYALNYIYANGWTDVTDDEFVLEGKKQFRISSQSLIRHLRRMSKIGLLVGHRLMESPDLFGGILDGHSAPRIFIRYTLPGMHAQVLESRTKAFSLGRRGHDLTAKEEKYWDTLFSNLTKPAHTTAGNAQI